MTNCKLHGLPLVASITTISSVHVGICPKCGSANLEEFKKTGGNGTALGIVAGFTDSLPPRFQQARLAEFQTPTAEHERLLEIANRFVKRVGQHAPVGGMVLLGQPGVGKTNFAICIGFELARMGLTPVYTSVADLVKTVRSGWGENHGADLIQSKFSNCDLLILDEVGVQSGSSNEKQIIFEVITARYNSMLPTILISNLTLDGVQEYVSERCVSRVRERGMVIPFKVQSYRDLITQGAA